MTMICLTGLNGVTSASQSPYDAPVTRFDEFQRNLARWVARVDSGTLDNETWKRQQRELYAQLLERYRSEIRANARLNILWHLGRDLVLLLRPVERAQDGREFKLPLKVIADLTPLIADLSRDFSTFQNTGLSYGGYRYLTALFPGKNQKWVLPIPGFGPDMTPHIYRKENGRFVYRFRYTDLALAEFAYNLYSLAGVRRLHVKVRALKRPARWHRARTEEFLAARWRPKIYPDKGFVVPIELKVKMPVVAVSANKLTNGELHMLRTGDSCAGDGWIEMSFPTALTKPLLGFIAATTVGPATQVKGVVSSPGTTNQPNSGRYRVIPVQANVDLDGDGKTDIEFTSNRYEFNRDGQWMPVPGYRTAIVVPSNSSAGWGATDSVDTYRTCEY